MKLKKVLLGLLLSLSLLLVGCINIEAGTYKVTFYNGSDVVETARYKKGEQIVLPNNPTREGEFFVGWDKDNDGKVDEITTCNSNMNIRAVFEESEKFTIIFKDGANELSKKVYASGEMPVAPTNPTREDYIFVGWDVNGDDEVDDIKVATANATYVAIYRDDNRTYLVEFYANGTLVSSNEYHLNDVITAPTTNPTKAKTEEFSYSFVGWDVNGDGTAEKFPFNVKGAHRFVAIFSETVNEYSYRLLDGANVLDSGTAKYGTEFTYTGEVVKKVVDKYYYLIGWDKNSDGKADDHIIRGTTDFQAIYTDNQLLIMHYEDQTIVNYVKAGETFELYNPTLPSSRKCAWYLDKEYQNPYTQSVMVSGNLELYGRSELSYTIDCSVLEVTPKNSVDSEDELAQLFNYIIFSQIYNYTVTINYETTGEDFATFLKDHCTVDANYMLSTTYNPNNKELKLTIQYSGNINTMSAKSLYEENSIPYYTQYGSANLLVNTLPRTDNFTLYIDSVTNTFEVKDSEQLYYVLEHGYRPIINNSNTNLTSLYNKMRNVLKEIINDYMDDYEKVLMIYEWLVMNVTYDRVALQLSNDPNVTQLHSFFLEGVFDENLAVCDGISKALVCLCNMEGIPAIRVTGTGAQNHAWNKVCINGKWYVVDATSGGTIINSTYEVLTHRFFLITDEDFSKIYTEDGKYYPGFDALGQYDYYDNFTYRYEDNDYKFKCSSKDDLVRVLTWFKGIEETNFTCDVELAFAFDSISSLMSQAMGEARYTTSLVYSLDGSYLLLVK